MLLDGFQVLTLEIARREILRIERPQANRSNPDSGAGHRGQVVCFANKPAGSGKVVFTPGFRCGDASLLLHPLDDVDRIEGTVRFNERVEKISHGLRWNSG